MATLGRRFWICGGTRSSRLGKEWTALSWKAEAEGAEAAGAATEAVAAVWDAGAAGLTATTIGAAPTTGGVSTHTRGNKFPKHKIILKPT
jgi:hypothetical protein